MSRASAHPTFWKHLACLDISTPEKTVFELLWGKIQNSDFLLRKAISSNYLDLTLLDPFDYLEIIL